MDMQKYSKYIYIYRVFPIYHTYHWRCISVIKGCLTLVKTRLNDNGINAQVNWMRCKGKMQTASDMALFIISCNTTGIGSFVFPLLLAWRSCWANNRFPDYLRHYDVNLTSLYCTNRDGFSANEGGTHSSSNMKYTYCGRVLIYNIFHKICIRFDVLWLYLL